MALSTWPITCLPSVLFLSAWLKLSQRELQILPSGRCQEALTPVFSGMDLIKAHLTFADVSLVGYEHFKSEKSSVR